MNAPTMKLPAGRIAAAGLGLVLVVTLLVLLAPKPADAATTFTVNRTGDANDRKINGVCDSSRKRGRQCTLRAAIQEANAAPETDTINFNIRSRASVKTISPVSPLPTITNPVTINGYSQPGASENTLVEGNDAVLKVQLNGTNAGADSNGLTIRASGTTIKGLVINRFGGNGIDVQFNGGNRNRVEGNFIGTSASGTIDLGNGNNGVRISAENNLVGGTSTGARNIISGNEDDGVEISENENTVEGNYIGTNAAGTADLGNSRDGVAIFGGQINNIGGTVSGARNVISGNGRDGVEISGSSALGNEVEGNLIGTNADTTGALGNTGNGVTIFEAFDNTIGGVSGFSASNIISGNGGAGVLIEGSAETPGNVVEGNFIGTNFFGTTALGNEDGVVIASGAQDNTIGGTPGGLGDVFSGGAGNVISGNRDDGVEIRDDALGNRVEGNFIGTVPDGTGALNNSDDGVVLSNADNNTIGGTASGARNVISGNTGDGVVLFGTGASGNEVLGNFIGTDKDGTNALGNSDGVLISSANGSTIGGTASGAGNRIAHNEGDGVLVAGGGAVGNRVLSNSVFSNGGLGIDLGTDGVTANDDDDPDASSNSNRLQNFPVITSATRSTNVNPGITTISGTLNSNPSQSYTVQCFVAGPGPFAAELDPSGHGEGQILVGADTTVTTGTDGDAGFSCVTGFPMVAGQTQVTATATNTATGDTSEFSLNVVVVAGP